MVPPRPPSHCRCMHHPLDHPLAPHCQRTWQYTFRPGSHSRAGAGHVIGIGRPRPLLMATVNCSTVAMLHPLLAARGHHRCQVQQ
jgi:hypothetical protein